MSKTRIALLLHDHLNDYQLLLHADCEQAARRFDLQMMLHSADKSAETQARQIRGLIAQHDTVRPQALLISPVSEVALMPLIHDAARVGIAWVQLLRWNDAIHDFRRQYPKVPLFAVLPDQHQIGRIQGKQARTLLEPGDELVCIQGPQITYSARKRKEGLEQELADWTDLKPSIFNADWSEEGGNAAMRSWLSTFSVGKPPNFLVVAQNDNMAVGARRALLAFGSRANQLEADKLRIIGCDGSPTFGQRLVTTGQLKATVAIPSVASFAVEALVTAMRTGKQPAAENTVTVESYPDLDILIREQRLRATEASRANPTSAGLRATEASPANRLSVSPRPKTARSTDPREKGK